jgi:hypothetical protein
MDILVSLVPKMPRPCLFRLLPNAHVCVFADKGKVNKFTPGGWLILSQVRASKNELAFPLVVGPQSIELLSNRAKDKVQKPDSSEKNNDETAVASANIFAENENL